METTRKRLMATRDFFEVILSFGWRMAQYWFYTVPMFFFMLFWRPWSAFLMLALSVFPQSKAVVKFTPPSKQIMSFVTAPLRWMMPSQFQGIHVIPTDRPVLFIGYDTAFHFEVPLLKQKLYESKGLFFRTILPQRWSSELNISNDKSRDGLKMAGKLLLSRLLHFFGAVEPELNERLIENKESLYLCVSSMDQSSMLLLERTIAKALEHSYVIIPVASVGTDDVITIPYRLRIGQLFSWIPYQLFWVNRKTTIPIPNFKRQINFVKFGRLRDKNSLSSNEKKEIKTLAHEIYEEIGSLTASLLTTQSNSFAENQQKNSLQSMMKNSYEQVKKGVNDFSKKIKRDSSEQVDLLLKKRSHSMSKEKEVNQSEKPQQPQSQQQQQQQQPQQSQSQQQQPQQLQSQPQPQPQATVISSIILEQTPLERNFQWEENVRDDEYRRVDDNDDNDDNNEYDEGESGEQQQQQDQSQQQQKSKKQQKQQSNQENEPNDNAFIVQESRAKKRHRRKMQQQQQQQEHLQSKRSSDSPSVMRSLQLDESPFENRIDSTPR